MMYADHLVFMVRDLSITEKFYTAVFGMTPLRITDDSIVYQIGETKIFFGLPYHDPDGTYDRDASGLNHWAIGLEEKTELEEADKRLTEAGIKHSPIIPCKQSGIPMIWFDDPDEMRVEFYLRGHDKSLR